MAVGSQPAGDELAASMALNQGLLRRLASRDLEMGRLTLRIQQLESDLENTTVELSSAKMLVNLLMNNARTPPSLSDSTLEDGTISLEAEHQEPANAQLSEKHEIPPAVAAELSVLKLRLSFYDHLSKDGQLDLAGVVRAENRQLAAELTEAREKLAASAASTRSVAGVEAQLRDAERRAENAADDVSAAKVRLVELTEALDQRPTQAQVDSLALRWDESEQALELKALALDQEVRDRRMAVKECDRLRAELTDAELDLNRERELALREAMARMKQGADGARAGGSRSVERESDGDG
eukprot:TRINITY_DN6824_c0_g1_i4.p1 TRINITY_DN6824_c0_g1~~TRINITY_DN6824_c0_g1_i4.p1  ORF type:complete len:297 (-),score=93.84 TRINITY_DN6824_c0_g1_i4:603-1493(-)